MSSTRIFVFDLEQLRQENWKLSIDNPAVAIPSDVGAKLATSWTQLDQKQILELFAPDAAYFPERVFYLPKVVESVASNLGLDVNDILQVYDGTLSLYETAVLMTIAEIANKPEMTETIRGFSERAKAVIARTTLKPLENTVKNAIRPQQTVLFVTDTFIARAVFNYLPTESQAAFLLVSQRLSSLPIYLTNQDRINKMLLEWPMMFRFFKNDNYNASPPEAPPATTLVLDTTPLVGATASDAARVSATNAIATVTNAMAVDALAIANSKPKKVALSEQYASMPKTCDFRLSERLQVELNRIIVKCENLTRTDATKLAEAQGIAINTLMDRAKRAASSAREALSLLNNRFPLETKEQQYEEMQFASSFLVRKMTLLKRAFKSIASHPSTQKLLRHTVFNLHRANEFTKLMDAKTIVDDGVYRPQNLFNYLPTEAFAGASNMFMGSIVDELAVQQGMARYEIPNGVPRSFLENTKVEFLLPQFPRGKNKSGQTICEPVLRGPYYVYARDLPKGDDVYNIDDYRQPGLLFGFKNGSPFNRTWALKQTLPQQNHNTFTMLDNNSMAFCKPIIRCERIVDREAQTTKLRVEMYIVSQQIGEEFQTYKKKLTDLAEDVREQNRITNTLQSQIENSDVGGNVTPTLTRQYEQQLVVFRNTIAKYNAAVDDMPSFPLVIYAAKVYETPPLLVYINVPKTYDELTNYITTSSKKTGLILTRSLSMADYQIMCGLEEFVSTVNNVSADVRSLDTPMAEHYQKLATIVSRQGGNGRLSPAVIDEVIEIMDSSPNDLFSLWTTKIYREVLNHGHELFGWATIPQLISYEATTNFSKLIGLDNEWVGADSRKFSKVDYYLFLRLMLNHAFRRAAIDTDPKWLPESQIKFDLNTPGGVEMEQLRNVYVDLSNVEISNTLEPTFFDVARDRRSREIIMDALDTNPLWPPLKKPFGNNGSSGTISTSVAASSTDSNKKARQE